MACPNCGYNNQPTNRFCVRCGIDVSAPAAPETPSFETGPPPGAAPLPPPPIPAPDPASSPNAGGHAAPNPWGEPHPPSGAPAPRQYAPPSPYAPPGPYGAPGSAPPPPPPYPGAPSTGEQPNPFAPPTAYAPPGGYPPPGAGPYAYPAPYAPSGYQPAPTNGLAIAALILGLVGWIPCGIGSIAAVVLGFVARSQIREAQGRQGGDGLALTGIILGFIAIGFWILVVVFGAINGSNNGSS